MSTCLYTYVPLSVYTRVRFFFLLSFSPSIYVCYYDCCEGFFSLFWGVCRAVRPLIWGFIKWYVVHPRIAFSLFFLAFMSLQTYIYIYIVHTRTGLSLLHLPERKIAFYIPSAPAVSVLDGSDGRASLSSSILFYPPISSPLSGTSVVGSSLCIYRRR